MVKNEKSLISHCTSAYAIITITTNIS